MLLTTVFVLGIRVKRRQHQNLVDRLVDNTKLNTDPKGKALFKKGLGLLVRDDYMNEYTFKRAVLIFMSVAQKTPDPLDRAYCFGWAGRCFEQAEQAQLAVSCYASALKLAPSDTFALERLGDLLSGGEKDEPAIEHYEKVLKYDPLNTRIHYKLGKTLSESGKHEKAIERYRTALNVHNGYVAPMAEAAIEYAKIGDKANALKFYKLALANDVHEFDVLTEAMAKTLQV
jgi:tetratricopeptide (TPR) repeat protein